MLKQESSDIQDRLNNIVAAKISYEKSLYWKKGDLGVKRKTYSKLVKKFKAKESSSYYDKSIRNLIVADSSAISKRIIYFTYQPEISSTIEKCAYLQYGEFLKIMLKNLHDTSQYDFILCYK